MKAWQQLPASVKLLAAAIVVVCLMDFMQRVYIAGNDTTRTFDPMAGLQADLPAAQMSDDVSTWLQKRRDAAQQQQEQQATSEPQAELMDGGVNLGDMRVRVRGIYTSSNQQRVALIDTQQLANRNVEITEISEGFELNGFTVSKISVNSVTFSGAEGETVTLPVFDY